MLWCSAIFPSVQCMMVCKAWVLTIGYISLFMRSCGNLTYSNTAHTTHTTTTESRYNRTPNPLPTHFHCVCLTCCGPSTTHLILICANGSFWCLGHGKHQHDAGDALFACQHTRLYCIIVHSLTDHCCTGQLQQSLWLLGFRFFTLQ